jgi:hypothetical protein
MLALSPCPAMPGADVLGDHLPLELGELGA